MRRFGPGLRRVAEPLDGPVGHPADRARPGPPGDRGRRHVHPGRRGPGAQHPGRRRAGHGTAHYDKIHLFDAFGFAESDTVAAGDDPVVIDVAGVPVGLTTCYDVRFPGLYTRLAEQGASVICVAASWAAGPGKVDQWQLLTRARALDSTTFVLAAGQADPATVGLEPLPGAPAGVGHSAAISPRGEVLAELGAEPGLLVVDLDLDDGHGGSPGHPGAAPIAASEPVPLCLARAGARVLSARRGGFKGGRPPLLWQDVPVSRAEDQPWSPFPVQDWSALPEDPLAYTAVDPSWAPPTSGSALVAAAGGARPGRSADRRGHLRLEHGRLHRSANRGHRLPAGRRDRGVRDGGDHPGARRPSDTQQVTESARFRGRGRAAQHRRRPSAPGCSARPPTSGTPSGSGGRSAPSTTTRSPRTRPPGCTGPTRPWSCWGRPARAAATSTARPWSSCPPTSPPGSTWTGSGSANDVLDYWSDFRADRGGGRLPGRDR